MSSRSRSSSQSSSTIRAGNKFPVLGRVQLRCILVIRAAAEARASPQPTSFSNRWIPISRTISRCRKRLSRRPAGTAYHLQNVALLRWYTGASENVGSTYSFPDSHALTESAKPCPARDAPFRPSFADYCGHPAEQPAQRTSTHRLLGRLWRSGFHHPASRDLATVGRHHRRLLHAR